MLRRMTRCLYGMLVLVLLASGTAYSQPEKPTVLVKIGAIKIEPIAENLEHPWGMAFLPDGRLLVTERAGRLRILDKNNKLSQPVKGTPQVLYKEQGGLLDVALDPDFRQNRLVYLSYAELGSDSLASTALGRGRLEGNEIRDFKVLFRQEPKVDGAKHFGGRILFSPEGHLVLTLAERFKGEPAQDLSNHLGAIVRLNRDGTIPKDNPFVGQQNARDEIWSYGHRNIESAAFDPATRLLWVAEMGPMGGDELNQPKAGKNYGWPLVSWGKHYDGKDIPDPTTRPDLADAVIKWTPTISPSGMIFYSGSMFSDWKGHALIGGLTSTGLVRVRMNGEKAEEVERIPLAVRTRDVKQAPDGSIYVLTDYEKGKVLRLHLMK